MTEISELNDAIAHVRECSGDPDAWRAGLSSTDLTVILPAAVVDSRELSGLLQKIRANHPLLFDPRTGAPVTPPPSAPPPVPVPPPPSTQAPPPPDGQQGDAAEAMKRAEGVLAQQNSSTAQLDLLVISAIFDAHTTTVEGGTALRALQRDVENAVRSRTDLDAPTGARDFQRFLIGKLREIGAVVETASLDDSSKAALASAWTALYEAAKGEASKGAVNEEAPDCRTSAGGSRSDQEAELPPYGADTGTDPLLDELLTDDPGYPATGSAPPGPPQLTAPAAAPMASPTLPTLSGLPGIGGGVPGGLALPGQETGPASGPAAGVPAERPIDDRALDELLRQVDDPVPAEEDRPDADPSASDSYPDPASESDPQHSVPAAGPTLVRLPNGDTVMAPNPQIANVLKAAIGGTPIGDAFRDQGIVIPPAGTAVPHPVDPARVSSGDIGMFTDRLALALDGSRALLSGQIQPVAAVSGPSFLGWTHPPGQGTTTPSASTLAMPPDSIHHPPPTRPATAVAHPR